MMGTSQLDAAKPAALSSFRLLTVAYGGVCYLIFLAAFLYAIGFVGNLVVPKSIDTGMSGSLTEALAIDLLLLGSFAIPHSIMARPRFKQWWTRFVPQPIERSTYVLTSSLLLALLFWQWQPLPDSVWQFEQPIAVAVLWISFAAGWLIVLISTFLTDHFDLFGLRQVYLHAAHKPYSSPPFRTTAFYRFVRHPIMLGFVIAFWSTPVMTWGHLIFAGMTTAYILVAIQLEERDLKSALGQVYTEYQRQVSMILPWRRLMVLLFSLPGLLAAASTASADDSRAFFERRIAPVLSEHCAACHNSEKHRGGLDLTNRKSLLEGGDNGPAIVPGKLDEGSLMELVSGHKPRMPKNGKPLTPKQLADLRRWIKTGAEWPEGVPVSAELWSLRPISRPKVPPVKHSDCVRTPIDAFILRRLEEEGLEPAPRADRITLIRRATFDLHGLPPTPQEIADFVADSSSDAFAKVVERLLSSPRYGERWGRHWLDLASYADSHGFELDYPRPNAWRYRDYVIQALNEDKHYDTFLREQLAGDVISPEAPSATIATGFLSAGPWDYSGFITAIQGTAASRGTRLVDLDNMLTTVMTTTVGLTIGCAKCHDHKFDPISQKDYYSLLSVFAGVRRGDRIFRGHATEEQARRMAQIRLDLHKKRIGIGEIDARGAEVVTNEMMKTHAKLASEIAELEAEYAKLPQVELTYAVVPETPPGTHVLYRGDTESPRERVAPAALSAVKELRPELTNGEAPEGARRLALARWLTNPANPLTARVMVNRLWHYHFGRGLVGTPGDFGFNGERPSHPELLDWLATEFQNRKWSIKAMHRLVMLSHTYQQASRHDEKAAAVDADNRLLWRMNRQRLTAEEVRDSILAVSGKLDLTMGGPADMPFRYRFRKSPVYDYFDTSIRPERWRRSVYNFVPRSTPDPFLNVLDFPIPSSCTPARASTNTPLQSLSMLNDPFVLQQAEHFAARLRAAHTEDVCGQVKTAYRLALGREPSQRELKLAQQFVQRRALFPFCRALFNANEFLYVD